MAKRSAGLLLFRRRGGSVEVLLAHPGGPLWARRDAGVWSLPKGETLPGEEDLACARREFAEELGIAAPEGPIIDLGEIRQASGKVVRGFAVEGELDPACVVPGTFVMQWPPRSGREASFPEVDRAEWFSAPEAQRRIRPAQADLVRRLLNTLGGDEEEEEIRRDG